jgi:7-keto-8-aminopelargonate synthetase-like enzyme
LSRAFTKRFPHNNYEILEKLLNNYRDRFEKILVIVEGVYSMDGDIAPIPELVKLKKKYGFFLMVDEAHSSGVIGKNGGGVDEYFGLEPDDIDIKMGTLSKAIGSLGGYIAGSMNLINYLKYNLPGFVFAAGISPISAAAALEAIRLIRKDNAIVTNLHDNIKFFISEANKRGFDTCLAKESPIIPVLIGKDEDAFILSKIMLSKGVFVPPAAYPAVPKNQSRLRFNVISEHKHGQILKALDTLEECMNELSDLK